MVPNNKQVIVAYGESGTRTERKLGLFEDVHVENLETENPRTVRSNFVPKECEVWLILQ
jgi:hypothetical protein